MRKSIRVILNGLRFGILLVGLCVPAVGRAELVSVWPNGYHARVPAGLTDAKAIAGGNWFSLALKADGHVVAWGSYSARASLPGNLADVKAIAAAHHHSLAVKGDGSVIAWANDDIINYVTSVREATNVPPGLGNVISVGAGYFHSLALRADGTVVAWGSGVYGTTNIPAGLSSVVAIASGEYHSLALKADGTVVAWGANGQHQTDVPAGLSNVTAVASGSFHNLALKADGTVVAWGHYGPTNLGGSTTPVWLPAGLSNVVSIAAGYLHDLALRSDGTVIAWGLDGNGRTNVPSVLKNVTAIAAGYYHSLALVHEGPPQILDNPQSQEVSNGANAVLSVTAMGWEPLSYRWYRNGFALNDTDRYSGTTNATLTISNAQLSDIGTYTVVVSNPLGAVVSADAVLQVMIPPFITSQSPGREVGAGTNVALSVTANGAPTLAYQWFHDGTELAGSTRSSLILTDVQPGDSGSYALLVANAYGSTQALISLTVTDSPPFIVQQPSIRQPDQSLSTNVMVPRGSEVTIDFSARGSLPLNYQWRFNGADLPGATGATLTLSHMRYDQTGFYNVVVRNPFGEVISAKFFVSVAQVYAWDAYYPPPFTPPGLTNVVAVAVGSKMLALKSDGRVVAWGSSTNVPASVTNVVAIAAGGDSSMALRSNGTVVVWGGYNSGITTNVPANVFNVVGIASGSMHSVALKRDGTVVAWGDYRYGQTNIPAGLSNVVSVVAGPWFSLALKADGKVVAWGSNGSQTNVPAGLSNVIAVAAGGNTSLALRSDGTVAAWGPDSDRVPGGLSNIVALSAGSGTLALKADGSITNWGYSYSQTQPVLSNVIAIARGGASWVAVIGDGSPALTVQPATQTAARGGNVVLHARAVGVQPMSYQWQLNGAYLPTATNASLAITNFQGKNTGVYRLIAANVLGSAISATAWVTMPFSTNLPAALNAINLAWTTGLTNAAWFAQIRETHDGDTAAQSGPITHNQQSPLQTGMFPGQAPGTLTFWWKVSSEEGFDFLKFFLDNSPTPLASISGETAWQKQTIHLSGGSHTLKWIYTKDGSVSDGQDAGWVDEVVFTPDPPVITRQPTPPSVTAGMGDNVNFYVIASDGSPSGGHLSYQWLKNGAPLIGGTDAYLTLTNATRRHAGVYAVRISNAGSSVLSSNATLLVRVPQRLQLPARLTDGSFLILSGDADGGALLPEDLAGFEVQTSTNLVNWVTAPVAPILTNGLLVLKDPNGTNVPARFYRMLERQ